jgi:hypothetical protein
VIRPPDKVGIDPAEAFGGPATRETEREARARFWKNNKGTAAAAVKIATAAKNLIGVLVLLRSP